MRIKLALCAVSLAVVAEAQVGVSGANSRPDATASTRQQVDTPRLTDEMFVTKAGQANLVEVQLARMALERARQSETRQFAERMIADHNQANARLRNVAQQLNIAMPEQLDMDQQTTLSRLDSQGADDFDDEYANQMEAAHKQITALYERAANAEAISAELRQLAGELLPTLRKHSESVDRLQSALD